MQTLFVDHLTSIDFAYFDPQRGIVGESLLLNVALSGELNQQGMLFDFSFVKKHIKECVDKLVDHKFLIPKTNPAVKILDKTDRYKTDSLSLELTCTNGELIKHISPAEAVFFIEQDNINPQTISQAIKAEIRQILPDNISDFALQLTPEKIDGSYYHYSHGLKKHFGDCQRIAHGHRSKIQVWQDDIFSPEWSSHIAELWQDIYLASKQDIQQSLTIGKTEYWTFRYQASQGLFELTIAKHRCLLIDSDSTVELIALFLADYIKAKASQHVIRVKAYEGVDKGAMVSV